MLSWLSRASSVSVVAALVLWGPGAGPGHAQEPPDSVAVVREGTWHVRQGDRTTSFSYGRPSDYVLFGDWNGDGVATPGVYRAGWWHLRNDNSTGRGDVSFFYGGHAGDRPIVGDWDGDGTDTVGIIRAGTWHLVDSHRGGSADITFHYGRVDEGDVPLAGDWDGDGIDTAGIVRDGTWHLVNAHRGGASDIAFTYGRVLHGDVAVAGDWDGDGFDTPGVVRDATWYLKNRAAGGDADVVIEYGGAADRKAVQGGTADYGSVWYRLAECESGQRWWLDSRYDGGLQFHPSTWSAYRYPGYSDYAYQAPPESEIAVARRVRRAQGWEAWPACTLKLGLR